MKSLRPHQEKLKANVFDHWFNNGHKDVVAISPTGSGKTVLGCNVIDTLNYPTAVVAHRKELVSQFSLTLNENEIPHSIIAPSATIKFIERKHRELHGYSTHHQSAQTRLAGIDTLVRRGNELRSWLPQVRLWVQDEAHHVLQDNKWGTGRAMFPNAIGLGLTADTRRADGKGLGRHADGIFDAIADGPEMRYLIDEGYLKDYRIICPPSDFDVASLKTGSTGDYSANAMKKAAQKSHIVGDVVQNYLKFAAGKQAVTFATDVETATEMAQRFNEAGVKSAVLSAKTHETMRFQILAQFERKEIRNIVNVDLFGEGFDCPAIECVIMARPTASFMLYLQQFGRGLRQLAGVTHGIIIDHVGNVKLHGLPDKPRPQSLDRRERGARAKIDPDAIPLRVCTTCYEPYERIMKFCPHCGAEPEVTDRSKPEFVDGDLAELDPSILQQLRQAADSVMKDPANVKAGLVQGGMPATQAHNIANGLRVKQAAQTELRSAIAWWAGYHKAAERGDSEIHRRFFHRYGVDVMTAQTLSTDDARKLCAKIIGDFGK